MERYPHRLAFGGVDANIYQTATLDERRHAQYPLRKSDHWDFV